MPIGFCLVLTFNKTRRNKKMIKSLKLNKSEKESLGANCYVEVSEDFIFVWGGGSCEAAFPIRHWDEVKNFIDKSLKRNA